MWTAIVAQDTWVAILDQNTWIAVLAQDTWTAILDQDTRTAILAQDTCSQTSHERSLFSDRCQCRLHKIVDYFQPVIEKKVVPAVFNACAFSGNDPLANEHDLSESAMKVAPSQIFRNFTSLACNRQKRRSKVKDASAVGF